MSLVKVTLPGGEIPVNGKQVSFLAPCDCSNVEGLSIDGKVYTIVDTMGKCVTGVGGAFGAGAVVSVILNVDEKKAFIQNLSAYTRNETLTSATASLLGLGENAVPNDAFGKLGEINLHWWKRRTESSGYNLYVSPSTTTLVNGAPADGWAFYYSDSVTTNDDGTITLVNPQSKTLTIGIVDETIAEFSNRYFAPAAYANLAKCYKGGEEVTCKRSGNLNAGFTLKLSGVYESWAAYYENNGEYEYVSSPNRNAYPDSGTEGIFSYSYLGVPFENAREGAKVVTGSYVGTGVYGDKNLNTLSFDSRPKFVMLQTAAWSTRAMVPAVIPNIADSTAEFYAKAFTVGTSGSGSGHGASICFSVTEDNTLQWYSDSTSYQFNDSGATYYYMVIL